jgi:hypothetical protein
MQSLRNLIREFNWHELDAEHADLIEVAMRRAAKRVHLYQHSKRRMRDGTTQDGHRGSG